MALMLDDKRVEERMNRLLPCQKAQGAPTIVYLVLGEYSPAAKAKPLTSFLDCFITQAHNLPWLFHEALCTFAPLSHHG